MALIWPYISHLKGPYINFVRQCSNILEPSAHGTKGAIRVVWDATGPDVFCFGPSGHVDITILQRMISGNALGPQNQKVESLCSCGS